MLESTRRDDMRLRRLAPVGAAVMLLVPSMAAGQVRDLSVGVEGMF